MQTIRLLLREFITHNVKRFIFSKPQGLLTEPGQAYLVAEPATPDDQHPFTPVSSKTDEVVEFNIKRYPQHNGLTDRLHDFPVGSELLACDVMGEIRYRGRGTFIAGGTGITPFLAIMRDLAAKGLIAGDSLLFSNRMREDVILESELRSYFGDRAIFTLTREFVAGYESRHIDEAFLKEKVKDFGQNFYVCGPSKFVKAVNPALQALGAGAQSLVYEK